MTLMSQVKHNACVQSAPDRSPLPQVRIAVQLCSVLSF